MDFRRINIKPISEILFIYVSAIMILEKVVSDKTFLNHIMGISAIIFSLLLAFHFRYCSSLFISTFFIAYSIYSIYIAVYVDPALRPDFYLQFTDETTYSIGLESLFLFSAVLYLLVNNNVELSFAQLSIDISDSKTCGINNALVGGICTALILIIVFTNYSFNGASQRSEGTPLFEYKILFLIIGMVYTRGKRYFKFIWEFLVIFLVAISFIGGNRADAIPIMIAYIFFYHNNIKPRRMCIYVLLGIVTLISIGAFRQTILSGGIDVPLLFERIVHEKMTFDTAYWAYVPTMSALSLANTASFSTKIDLLVGQVLYIFAGGRFSNNLLQIYSKKFYDHVNGFVSPAYFYFWFGMFGVLIFTLIVYWYIKKTFCIGHITDRRKRIIYICMSCYFISMTPRWFLYGPYSLIRGGLLMLLSSCFFFFVDMITSPLIYRSCRETH